MTEIISSPVRRHSAGVKRMKKDDLRVDMTPMVDLGFLLISFFIFTTEITKPRVTDLFMPKDGEASPVAKSKSLTILIGSENQLFFYFGKEEDIEANNSLMRSSYSVHEGIGRIIRQKQQSLEYTPEGRRGLVVIIKPTKGSTYKNLVDVLDEMLINNVTRHLLDDPTPKEIKMLSSPEAK